MQPRALPLPCAGSSRTCSRACFSRTLQNSRRIGLLLLLSTRLPSGKPCASASDVSWGPGPGTPCTKDLYVRTCTWLARGIQSEYLIQAGRSRRQQPNSVPLVTTANPAGPWSRNPATSDYSKSSFFCAGVRPAAGRKPHPMTQSGHDPYNWQMALVPGSPDA